MNLHYSQTIVVLSSSISGLIPLWIYITLKHNMTILYHLIVLYLYEFTLLSNRLSWLSQYTMSYTSMNLHYSQTMEIWVSNEIGLIPLWIYITLKPRRCYTLWLRVLYLYEFTLLSNKLFVTSTQFSVLYLYEFTLLSNPITCATEKLQSYTSMNLHYSQTFLLLMNTESSLIPLWIYITLKQGCWVWTEIRRLIPLWIYITLKP